MKIPNYDPGLTKTITTYGITIVCYQIKNQN